VIGHVIIWWMKSFNQQPPPLIPLSKIHRPIHGFTILQYVDAKEKGLVDKDYVTGCLSQRYKDDLEVEIPQVDAFFGTRDLPALLKKFKADYKHELVGERLLTHPSHYAYMKISEGCDRPCSFCAIPLMRGNHISK